jgi:TrmH family RNA methyltransferase
MKPAPTENAAEREDRFRAARRDPQVAVLEGLHALKHACRFGAELLEVVVTESASAEALAAELAPDALPVLRNAARVPEEVFNRLSPVPHGTGVIALARRPANDVTVTLAAPGAIVLLERPTHAGNIGAAVRVAAAARAAGVLAIAGEDPWSPAAVRGGAGLQYALPVARIAALPESDRPLIAVHPGGDAITAGTLPDHAIYAFGSERTGLSGDLRARASRVVRIPMRTGVSSLNLATAVAVILYALESACDR